MNKKSIVKKEKNNYIRNIRINRIFSKMQFTALFLIAILLSPIPLKTISANDNIYEYGKYIIYSYSDSHTYITYQGRTQHLHEYYYLDKNSKKMPAYCMTLGLDGAEKTNDGYLVNSLELLKDKVVNNIILNGYPYKTVSELGLTNESEARYATQFAIWIKLNNLDITQIAPINDEYTRVVKAIKNIYSNGINFNLNYTNGVTINEIEKNTILDEIDEKYYSKIYELEYGDNILDIDFKLNGINDYTITDLNNKKIENLVGNKRIKILFPRKTNNENAKCDITIDTKYKENAILFAKSEVNGMQDVSLTLEPIKYDSTNLSFNLEPIHTKLKVIKKDATDDTIFIENVKFNIYDINDNLLGTYFTDENGIINIDIENDLGIYGNDQIKIVEIDVPSPYIIDKENNTKIITLNVGNTINTEFKNKKEEIKKTKQTENNKTINIIKKELPKTGY